MSVKDLQVSDSQITEIYSTREFIAVTLSDWQDNKWRLVFRNAIAIEAFSPEGEDLSALLIEKNNATAIKAQEVTQERGDFYCYLFSSAWTDTTILTIVAEDCEVEFCGVVVKNSVREG